MRTLNPHPELMLVEADLRQYQVLHAAERRRERAREQANVGNTVLYWLGTRMVDAGQRLRRRSRRSPSVQHTQAA